MSRKMKDLYLFIMYLLALAGVILLTADGIFKNSWVYFMFSVLWLLSFTIRNLLIFNTDRYRKLSALTYVAEIALMMLTGGIGAGSSIRILLCLTLADCCIVWGLKQGLACLGTIITGYLLQNGLMLDMDMRRVLLGIIREVPLLVLVGLLSYLIGRVLKSSTLLEGYVKDIEEREVKLRVAYLELSSAYDRLEEMATLKERNRIAREIHDTVGHTLTTVIVEMEAGKMLADKDPQQAREKYDLARVQALKALNEMRYSVRMLAEETNEGDLKQKVTGVLEETSVHSGAAVRHFIELPGGFRTTFDDMLVRALKEGISNSIRHGKSTAFLFRLALHGDMLQFDLQDNGTGCEKMVPGFGLDNMKKGIEQAGGSINFNSEAGEGFEIKIELPVRLPAAS